MPKYYYIINQDGGVLSRNENILEKDCERAVVLDVPHLIAEYNEQYGLCVQLENLLKKERYAPSIDINLNGRSKTVNIEHIK